MRIVVSAYALAVWMISCAYPPFLYAEALAIAVMLIACRRDLLTLPRLLDAAAAALLGLLPFALYFRHLIPIMQATVYPGQREIAAGGISWARLLAQLWPGVTTRGYEPIAAVGPANAVNVTMLSTLLPIYALALTDVRSTLTRLWRANPVALLSVTTACGVLICWTFFWFPIPVARVIGLTEMLPKRAMLALGLILNITSSLALTRLPVQITRSRLALLGSITLAGALIKLVLTQDQEDEAFGWMDLVPWVCLTLILLHARLIRAPHKQASGVFAAALLGNVLTFGLFNPVQSAIPIFSLNRDAIQQHLMETAGARVSSEGTLIVPGRYGAVLAGVGLPTITHVLYYPQQAFFRRYFPDISSEAFDTPE